ncbi:hypothetical protein D3C85_906970 [compost metagenome]
MVMMSREKKMAGPTSMLASTITCQRFLSVSSVRSICLWTFSIITMAPSTMAPMAMAMPPRDMMLALIPCRCMTIKATRIAMGNEITTTRDERRWNRKARQTSTTTANSSSSLPERLSMARWIRSDRS